MAKTIIIQTLTTDKKWTIIKTKRRFKNLTIFQIF